MANQNEPRLLIQFVSFCSGWVLLIAVGVGFTLWGYPLLALVSISAIGLVCSLIGFGGCEMPLAMAVFTTVGALAFTFTPWAWIAPMLTGGLMVCVAMDALIDGWTKSTEENVG